MAEFANLATGGKSAVARSLPRPRPWPAADKILERENKRL